MKSRDYKVIYEGFKSASDVAGDHNRAVKLTEQKFGKMLEEKKISPYEFDLVECAIGLFGYEGYREVCEAGLSSVGAVDSTAFSNIVDKVLSAIMLENYQDPAFAISSLVPNRGEANRRYLNIPGVGGINASSEEELQVNEGAEFPTGSFDENWATTPRTQKRGKRINVTREALLFNETQKILDRAAQVGQELGYNKELRAIDVLCGGVNPYVYNGTAYNTYLTSGLWINDHVNALADRSDVANAEKLLNAMTDPDTGRVINTMPKHVIFCADFHQTIQPFYDGQGFKVLTNTHETVITSPMMKYTPVMSRHMQSRMVSKLSITSAVAEGYWFLGDLTKLMAYHQNIPLEIRRNTTNWDLEFERDIVVGYRAAEMGAYFVLDPRQMVRNKPS